MRHVIAKCLALLVIVSPLAADRIAIVGGGGGGLNTAWLLEQDYDVTLYEMRDRLGGHVDSVDLVVDGKEVTVEGGFEFFSESQYIHFFRLLNHFDIPLDTFTLVSTFYNTNGKDTIILPPYYHGTIEWESLGFDDMKRMVQLLVVIEEAEKLIASGETGITLETFLEGVDVCKSFKEDFLYPFLAAGWGVETPKIKAYSAYNSLKYLVMGKEGGTYKWYEVVGGLGKYIAAVAADLKSAKIKLGAEVVKITYSDGIYTITEISGESAEYDHLVLGVHADQAGWLLKDIPESQDLSTILRGVKYIDTYVALHGDERFMPPDKDDWRVVNIRYDGENAAISMYKKRKGVSPIFKTWVTLDVRAPDDDGDSLPSPLHELILYKHAVNDLDYFHAQRFVQIVQGNRNLWFAGSWTYDNDSHESALFSAMTIARRLAPDTDRLRVLTGE